MKTGHFQPGEQPETTFELVGECLYRNASSGTYYALVKRGGKQFRRSLKTKDRALANRRLREFLDKITKLTDVSGGARVTFAELSERWMKTVEAQLKRSSATRRRSSLNNLLPVFGTLPVRNITTRMCEEWMHKRVVGIAASTFNIDLETLRAVFTLAKRDGLILENPTDHISRRRKEKPAIVIPTKEQFRNLVATMRQLDVRAQHGANLIELLALSGMRLGEATSIRWSDVDFERDRFTVTGGEVGTKNHEARTVPLFPALRALFERLKKERDSDPITPEDLPIIPIQTAKKSLATACKNAGLLDFGHHTMRHFFVSNAIEAGIDFKAIAAWIGHKDGGILVAKTYGHLRDAHSSEMAKRMTFEVKEYK